jgi:hypothetical protein
MECLSFENAALRDVYDGVAGKILTAPARGGPRKWQIVHEILITDEY